MHMRAPSPPLEAGAGEQGGAGRQAVAGSQVGVPVENSAGAGNPNMPPIELDLNLEGVEWPTTGNWSINCLSRLFHVFAEAKVRAFVLKKDTRPSRSEFQAGQTPRDKFWSVCYWLFNYGHHSDWFHPTNEFGERIGKVACINPDELGQHRDIKYLRKKYDVTRKTLMLMLEAYKKSGQHVDATQPWGDPAIEDFFEMSGGGQKRGNAGVFYCFLLALKYPILQTVVDSVLDEEVRISGSVELEGEVLEGSRANNSASSGFLDDGSSTGSAGSSAKRRRGGAIHRNVDDMCKEMRKHLRLDRVAPVASMQEQVATMGDLHKQMMESVTFLSKMGAELRAAGAVPEDDPTYAVRKEELANVREQVRKLRAQITEQMARQNAESIRSDVASERSGRVRHGRAHRARDDDDEEDHDCGDETDPDE